jgi:type II secretory pathway component PulK
MKRRRSRAKLVKRRGTVIVATLVCLLVVMAILGTMFRGTLRDLRQLRTERDLLQAELLLQAGRERAIYRLVNDTNYRGETWNLPADAISDKGEGRVTIEITSAESQKAGTAKILAEYPLGSDSSIRRSMEFQMPTQNTQE